MSEKRKGLGCCGCMLIVTLLMVLVIGGAAGVGYYYGNDYMKKNFDMSIGDAISVIRGLYKADHDMIVTNAPSSADEKAFYSKVGGQLYLKEDTLNSDTFEAIAGTLTGGGSDDGATEDGSGSDPDTVVELQVAAVRRAAEDGNATLALENLICRDNIDIERIRTKFSSDYDFAANYAEDFVIRMSDRELSAMLLSMVEDTLAEAGGLVESIQFEQMSLLRRDDTPIIQLVVSADLKAMIATFGDSFIFELITMVVPNRLYLGVELSLSETVSVDFWINQMSEKQRSDTYKLIDGALKLASIEKDARTYIGELVNEYAGHFITVADSYLDFDKNVTDGYIDFDIYGALAETAFPDQGITGTDLAVLYTSVLGADAQAMIEDNEDSLFEDKYLTEGGVEVYSPVPIDKATVIDYREEFLEEFRTKFLVRTEFYRDGDDTYFTPTYKGNDGNVYIESKLNFGESDPPRGADDAPLATLYRANSEPYLVTDTAPDSDFTELTILEYVELEFSDMAALMGVGTSDKLNGLQLEKIFDPHLITAKMGGGETDNSNEWFVNQSGENLKFRLTDKMLAALVDVQTSALLSGENALTESLKLKFVSLEVGEPEDVEVIPDEPTTDPGTGEGEGGEGPAEVETFSVTRKYMVVGFVVNTQNLFEGVKVVSGLLDDQIGLVVRLEITPEIEEKYLTAPVLRYCNYTEERTQMMTDTLKKAGMDFFDTATLQEQLGKPVRDVIVKMSDTLGGVEIVAGATVLPDVFSLLSSQMFVPSDSKTYGGERIELSGADIHGVMQGIYNLPPVMVDNSTGSEKHYLTTEGGLLTGVYGTTPVSRDNDTVNVDKLNAALSASGGLDIPSIPQDLGEVIGYYNGDGSDEMMYLTYEYDLARYLEGGGTAEASLLTFDKVYATFVVTKQNLGGYYTCELIVNEMTKEARDNLERMMTYFDADSEGEFAKLEAQIGVFAYYVDTTLMPMLEYL